MLNPAVLTRSESTSEQGDDSLNNSGTQPTASFQVGDMVQISSDLERVKSLQLGHGGWVAAMAQVTFTIAFS